MRLRNKCIGSAAVAFVVATVASAWGRDEPKGPTLEDVKALVGTWVAVDEEGRPTEEVVSVLRVTAGGSAVLEIEFPGAEHEMVTLYTMNGDRLELTHYCIAGNQPHMIARRDSAPNELIFECDGKGGSIDCAVSRHMHRGHLVISSADRMRSTWDMIEEGQKTYTADFQLARKRSE